MDRSSPAPPDPAQHQARGRPRGESLSNRLKAAGKSLKRELEVYRLVLRHRDTPLASRLLLATAVGYALMPFDLIPDVLPVLGQLDDLVIVPLLVFAALQLLPQEVLEECRATASKVEPVRDC